jgi:indolepyruvate decarboxylase
LGVGVANALLRPTVLVGDGAFQMTGMELSTIVRHGLNPIVIVLDNQGYGTERLLHPGDYEFNEIQPWNYARLPEVIGRGVGHEVFTEEDFENALTAAISNRGDMHLIQVHIPRDDASRTLSRLAARLSSRV